MITWSLFFLPWLRNACGLVLPMIFFLLGGILRCRSVVWTGYAGCKGSVRGELVSRSNLDPIVDHVRNWKHAKAGQPAILPTRALLHSGARSVCEALLQQNISYHKAPGLVPGSVSISKMSETRPVDHEEPGDGSSMQQSQAVAEFYPEVSLVYSDDRRGTTDTYIAL